MTAAATLVRQRDSDIPLLPPPSSLIGEPEEKKKSREGLGEELSSLRLLVFSLAAIKTYRGLQFVTFSATMGHCQVVSGKKEIKFLRKKNLHLK